MDALEMRCGFIRMFMPTVFPDFDYIKAATSMVRSLSKKRKKPAGSGACISDGEAFTHLVIPDESRRTLKVRQIVHECRSGC